ncbi:MAG TPA: DsbA family protein [Acidimicrobiales bacterium]|nr:DsbA family protein [Acidimicrobiales bacterium]
MDHAPLTFAVTWDYRCPFARNAHEHLVAALEAGAAWDVTFVPFSLSQVHVPDGGTPAWDDPSLRSELLALEAGIVVRDRFPERFLATHRALFAARHDEGSDLRESEVIRATLTESGVDAEAVFAEIEADWPLETLRKEHEASVAEHDVFGVPTFIVGDAAVFVRLMTRPGDDAPMARRTIERVVSLAADAPELNEFKHTKIGR